MSYEPKVYREQGAEKLVVANGGAINVESGGEIQAAGTQASAIADLTLAYTANDPGITPDGSVTIADGSAPSSAELLEFLEELEAKVEAILAALRGVGIIAS